MKGFDKQTELRETTVPCETMEKTIDLEMGIKVQQK